MTSAPFYQTRGQIIASLPPERRTIAERLFDSKAIAPEGYAFGGDPLFSSKQTKDRVAIAARVLTKNRNSRSRPASVRIERRFYL